MLKVVKVRQTCSGNPSQWEGITEDGQFIYVRYRWGYLQIGKGETLDTAVFDESIFGKQIGLDRDGHIGYSELKEWTWNRVEWPERMIGENFTGQ